MDIWVNVANVAYLLAYFVRDSVVLRLLSIAGAACLLPYFYFRPEPLLAPIWWNGFFIALNAYWVLRLLLERRPASSAPVCAC